MQPDLAEPTERASTYPPDLADLLPRARVLTESLGELPSRNRLMAELRVGAPKATAIRDVLAAEAQSESAEPDPDPDDPGTNAPEGAPAETADDGHPDPTTHPPAGNTAARRPPSVRSWPLLLLAAPAFVAIWSGWVGLGGLTGFGEVRPLPGIWDEAVINIAITLPIGMEAYAAYAIHAWLSNASIPPRARRFARWSGIGSLGLGAAGQIAYHLMAAAGITIAPWQITTAVAVLPVAVLGMGVALASLLRDGSHTDQQGAAT